LVPEVAALGVPTLQKPQYDAFFATDLEARLRAAEVGQVVVAGVLTTLLRDHGPLGLCPRLRRPFPVDGTATYACATHLSSLRALDHGFAGVPTVDELRVSLSATPRGPSHA